MTPSGATFRVTHRSSGARIGLFEGARHSFETPIFMPVGTRGAVRLMSTAVVEEIGFEVLLANTYHLMLRPGTEVISKLGGLHDFSGWSRAMLTDSGGFQVMSLGASYSEKGARFRSVYDGSWVELTPEGAVEEQERIGADIAMVLDVCTQLPAKREILREAMHLTHSWAKRSHKVRTRSDQSLFAIVQGGTELDLRRASAEAVTAIGFDGYGIGGLAVGEERALTIEVVAQCCELLPLDKPRYLMGVGDPSSVLAAIEVGVDMFDCVTPTRVARHGLAMTWMGKRSLKRSENRLQDSPIEEGCLCSTCRWCTRGLLHHLLRVDQSTAGGLISVHNLHFMQSLIYAARSAILTGTLSSLRREVDQYWA